MRISNTHINRYLLRYFEIWREYFSLFNYFSSQRAFKEGINWEGSLVAYKLEKLNQHCNETESLFQSTDYAGPLNLQEQLDITSLIPNNQHFLWSLKDPTEQQVKFAQRKSEKAKDFPWYLFIINH